MKKFVVFGAGLALGGIAGYFGYKKLEDMKKAKRVTERRTYPQYNYSYSYSRPYVYKHYTPPMKYKDVYFETKEKAEEVLHKLIKIAGEYGRVTVAAFFEASGKTASSFTDNNWGWMDSAVEWASVRYSYLNTLGWYIDLPDPIPID